ncbi:ribosome biogenesis GTPase YlqF [Pelotomaculum propionicicum]|uniref:ribosome biogenesis GTPase YlqF n=1 Tax=Pelotomaculum propionicicum TaxID=258475 RepID=UPI003B77E1B7
MDIQWFPGHMAKTRRQIKEDLKLVDVVIEVLDARIPQSSRNPDINIITGGKPRLIVLNKSDLADPVLTRLWEGFFLKTGVSAAAVDSLSGRGIRLVPGLVQQLTAARMAALAASGRRSRPARCMVVGIPNVGKSFFINKLAGRSVTRTEDRPGVTRGRQWIRVAGSLDLMDTPGVLWPKFEDTAVSFRLAATGAIKEDIYDLNAVAGNLLKWLAENYPHALRERYKLVEELPAEQEEILRAVGSKRGFLKPGGDVDTLKAAQVVLKEFRSGKLGRFTLEAPESR